MSLPDIPGTILAATEGPRPVDHVRELERRLYGGDEADT